MQLKDGTLLYEGKYRIIRLISSEDYGYTYEALSARTDSKVAIREFYIQNCSDRHEFNGEVTASTQENIERFEKMKKRFIEEAKTLFQFNHPNIVHVIDVFLENGTAYYAMDYVNGITLKQLVQQKGRLTERESLSYMDQLCDAIEYLHSKSRMHLDIRPANAIISPNGRLTLVDFGFSKRLNPTEDAHAASMHLTSNNYSPLELHVESDTRITPVSDIYSLGATMYKLLTGNTPPDAAMLVDYPLGEISGDISASVEQAVRKAMSPNKADRPQTVSDFRRMLHAPVHASTPADGTNSFTTGENTSYNTTHNTTYNTTPNTGFNSSDNTGNNMSGNNSNGFSSRSGQFEDESTRLDEDEATLVTPDPHRGSQMSQIDFHFETIREGEDNTELDSGSSSSGNTVNAGPSVNHGNNGNGSGSGNGNGHGNNSSNNSWQSWNGFNHGGSPSGGSNGGNRRWKSGGNRGAGNRPRVNPNLWRIAVIVALVLLVGGGLYWAYSAFMSPGSSSSLSSSSDSPIGSSPVREGATATAIGTYANNDPELMGELNGHFWVDLGLPSGTKWATTNVGAENPTDLGGYYAWGETSTKEVYNYENAATYEKPMGDIAGNLNFDVASKQWGENWRLPTKEQYAELLKNCSYRWVEIDDVKGGLFTSRKNGQSIFLPAAGFRYGVITSDTDASYIGVEGSYWTDTPVPNDEVQEFAYGLRLYGNSIQDLTDKFHRGTGRTIRPVAK